MNFSHILFKSPEQATGSRIGLLGGGGKTSLLFQLGAELAHFHPKVLMSAITKAGATPKFNLQVAEKPLEEQINNWFVHENPLYLLGRKLGPEKYQGLTPNHLKSVLATASVCIFEADGARNRPFKVHTKTDPVLPPWTTHVIIVIGAEVVDSPLNEKTVHRSELFSQRWQLPLESLLTPQIIAGILVQPEGYLSRIKHQVKLVYFINKADEYRKQALQLVKVLKRQTTNPVLFGSVNKGWWEAVA